MLRRISLHTLKSLALALLAVGALVLSAQLCGPGAEAVAPAQAKQTRTVDWYYWLDTGTRQIQRAHLGDAEFIVETVVTSSETSVPKDVIVEPDGSYVYWTDDGFNQVRRKKADGSGDHEVIATGLSTPLSIEADGTHVYWADDGTNRLQRVAHDGSGGVQTLADSSDGVSVPRAIALHGGNLYWADDDSNQIARVSLSAGNAVTVFVVGTSTIGNPYDLAVASEGEHVYAYWIDRSKYIVYRARVSASPYVPVVLARNLTSTPVDDPIALALYNNYVYWLDEDDNALRRVENDGDSFQTLTTATGGSVTDLALNHDGSTAYWLSNGNNRISRISTNGSGSVENVVTTGLNLPSKLRFLRQSQSVDGSCITDVGTLPADYGSRDWNADIDADCSRAFYAFRLDEAADIRVTATSPDIDPDLILRRGGIDGEVVQAHEGANGALATFVFEAAAGQYTLEMARGDASTEDSGSFSLTLQTQPSLSGCDVNLGMLSSEQLQVYGKYDPSCGGARKYYVYLEFQASISVSASGVGFTPRIELRPGGASDSATATATHSGNPADIYRQVASGSYRINLENITEDDTYNLVFQAFGLPPPTRTPIPTPTPHPQVNLDVRLEPDPRGVDYAPNQTYAFRLEGNPESFPVLVRVDNDLAFSLTASAALDCSAGAELTRIEHLGQAYLHVCAAGAGGTIEVLQGAGQAILAAYSVRVPGVNVPDPAAVEAPNGYTADPEDRIKMGVLINAVCETANQACDVDLIRNSIGAGVAGLLFFAPTGVRRGRASAYSSGIGLALAIVGLMVAHLWVGLPQWWAGAGVAVVIFLAGAQVYLRMRRIGS